MEKKKSSAEQCDGIKYDMIKALSDTNLSPLLNATPKAWTKNITPNKWHRLKIAKGREEF